MAASTTPTAPVTPSPTPPVAPAPDECVIDKRGDLWLQTNGTASSPTDLTRTTRFRVCSRTLARSSTVFEKMLFGPFAESQPKDETEWEVKLPDDATSAMRPILELMHSNFNSFRRTSASHEVKLAAIYFLVAAADKYDCVHLLKPFAAQWVRGLPSQLGEVIDLYRLTWIYYQLGCEPSFQAVGTKLMLYYPATKEPAVLGPLPPGLHETVTEGRIYILTKFLGDMEKSIQALISGGSEHKLCKDHAAPASARKECEARMLGQLIRDLHGYKLWPLPLATETRLSTVALAKIIVNLAQVTPSDPQDLGSPNHSKCRPVSMPCVGKDGYVSYAPRYQYNVSQAQKLYIAKQAKLLDTNGVTTDLAGPDSRALWPC